MAPSMDIIDTSEITMLAWIKSEGEIPHYAGVIFNRGGSGSASGLDIAHEQVCYHWADTQYSYRSGLYPENDVWNLVAITITPTAGKAYLGDSKGNTSLPRPTPSRTSQPISTLTCSWGVTRTWRAASRVKSTRRSSSAAL